MSDHRYILYLIDTPQVPQKMTRNSRRTNWNKFKSELEGILNYHGVRIENRIYLETLETMVNTSLNEYFESSCFDKRFQNKNVKWTNEMNKLRKNTRRNLRNALSKNVSAHWKSYPETQSE